MDAKAWSVLLGSLAAALTLGVFVARSVAASEVMPLRERVSTLEAQRAAIDKKLDEVGADVKELLRRHPIPSQYRQEP